jgi:hypothetical protein
MSDWGYLVGAILCFGLFSLIISPFIFDYKGFKEHLKKNPSSGNPFKNVFPWD